MRRVVELPRAYRLLNHGPTVLVSAAHAGRRNIMAASWSMALDFAPPKVAVVIDKSTYTRGLVEASGSFALNVPCRAQAAATLAVGGSSGRDLPADEDKFAAFGLQSFAGSVLDVPLLEGCVAWLECRVLDEPHNQQRYDLFIGEVVAAWADTRVFADGRWITDPALDPALRTIHYVAGGQFFATGEAFDTQAAPPLRG
ncbi:cob(II)yrinic acid a,c-diamide reductase [Burkholderiaceae bacterium]|nr:cob(II)yrinic acid a,c-diamide reductase [Burkholderiaceae bacterium]